ncbi:polyprenyl synthetase family protein [Nocardia sp. CDC159]|uniref:Polyprenyl synthetase family protein n=1 Tax=Nocardia pulmonis TaxID=2951408 RepID=A0A9X2E315_9NOCA|nr:MULTISPECIES: polyprenyl synthetase family protein [Nocardia]MCM6773352.1 polyprenyl synthetase family protein [Nocardia pulmonis]MCM6786239.1 polyprenyl synthetase family protein [Nocardia sp. CDC159]
MTLVTAVRDALTEFFDTRRELVDELGPVFVTAADALRDFVLRGGKRTRPAFAWTGWLGAGGDPDGPEAVAVLQACSALELVQACALVHDDIIDSSRTRRGFPTVHVDFERRHRERGWGGDSAHFGTSVAILIGDLALAWADDMVAAAGLNPAAYARFAPVWAAMRTEVLGGQLLDIHGEAGADDSVEAALRINRYKTAAYTIERPLHLGAALADADAELIAAYREFGTDIGIAFQLRDDLLGVFGDPAVTGKPSGDDLREGKRTVLIAEALRLADASDPTAAKLIRSSLGTDLSTDEVAGLRAVITELGAVAEVERRITDLTERGLAALEGSSAAEPAKRRLHAMAVAATARVA